MTKLETIKNILADAFEEVGAFLESAKLEDGKNLVLDYDFHLNDGGDMSNSLEVYDFNKKSIECIVNELKQQFITLYDDFDEDDFVRVYMNTPEAPCIRNLLSDGEELCEFYSNMAINISNIANEVI